MISASAADAHRFGRVKRNGYDPAEVDAVVARLVDALRSYERSTANLEERLAEADVSADAIRRTFIAAEQTRDQILEAAREQARRLTSEAETEAAGVVEDAMARAAEATERSEREVTALADLADRLDLEIARHRETLLRDAEDRANALLTDAEREAAQRTVASFEQARAEAEASVADIEARRRRAELTIRTVTMASAWTRREAQEAARYIVAEAKDEAALIVAEATRERGALSERIAELRIALSALEASAARVAALTEHHSGVLDLTTIERMEALDLDFAALDLTVVDAEPVDAPTEPAAPPQPAAVAPVIEGGSLDEPPRLAVAEATAATDAIDMSDDGEPAENEDQTDEPLTYYQRSTGIPLSERVRLARRSG